MTQVGTLLQTLLREAWVALTAALGIFVLLALLVQVLRAAGASALGARLWVSEAAAASAALLALALFAWLGVPVVVEAAQLTLPASGGCGPIGEVGTLTAGLIGALAAVRILLALGGALAAAAVGGSAPLSGALLAAGEAILGMTLAAAALPLASIFWAGVEAVLSGSEVVGRRTKYIHCDALFL